MSWGSSVNCPNCGERVDATADNCPSCGHDLTLTSHHSNPLRLLRRRIRYSERLEATTAGVLIGVFSLFLPWVGAFLWSTDESGTFVIAQVSMNILDLFASNEIAIVLSASLFIAGMLLTYLSRWLVILQLMGMIGISFTMTSYVSTRLPTVLNPSGTLSSTTGVGLGYFLGWLSILILVAVLIDQEGKTELLKRSKQLPPSEKVDKELGGVWGFQIRRRGL